MKEKIEQVIRELEEKASECEKRFKKTREGFSMGAFSAFSESAEMLRQVIEDENRLRQSEFSTRKGSREIRSRPE